jgi:hypothetical protein
MLNVSKLSVSLTKHGAHKLSLLLRKYDKDNLLNHLEGVEPGINIEAAQARANLSVGPTGVVPEVWNKARTAGTEAIDGLTLLAIIFSHRDLIRAMREGRNQAFRGIVRRGQVLDGKAVTNFAHTLEELGYSVDHTPDHISFNLARLFEIPGLHKLAFELLQLKMRPAGWLPREPLVDALVAAKLNEVLAITPDQFRNWLANGDIDSIGDAIEDADFFTDASEEKAAKRPFAFKAGHNAKKTGSISIAAPKHDGTAELLHNKIQTSLYESLVERYGRDCVGTEVDSGLGTSIDIVVKTAKFCWFYEIKVAKTIKAVIRQAVPQLLEYAYWRSDGEVAEKLIIVAKFKLTKDAAEYLDLLRKRFNLPIHYEQHSA